MACHTQFSYIYLLIFWGVIKCQVVRRFRLLSSNVLDKGPVKLELVHQKLVRKI